MAEKKKKTYTLEDLQAIQRTVDPGKMRDLPRLLKGIEGPYTYEQLQGLPTGWMTERSKSAWGQILSSLASGITLPGQKPTTPRYTPEGFDPGTGPTPPSGTLPPGVPGILAPGIKPPFSPLDPATLTALLGNATTASPFGRGLGMHPPGMGGGMQGGRMFPGLLGLGQLLPQLMQGKGGPPQGPR